MNAPKKSNDANVKLKSSLFQPAQNQQAFLKMGILGWGGSGKSHTAWATATGLAARLSGNREKAPILFLDSETGSDFFKELADAAKIPFLVKKSRSFDDLVAAMDESKKLGGVFIIDSITHFWTDVCDSFLKAKNRTKLRLWDWGPIKKEWHEGFATRFVVDPTHIIMCGRAAYEYDMSVNAEGEKEIEKTGTKMKAEGEMGYEPSLLVEMVREPKNSESVAGSKAGKKKVEGQLWDHVAYVLKDRSRRLEGVRVVNPDFSAFAPHVDFLNLGGEHFSFDPTRNSVERFSNDPEKSLTRRITDTKIALEEIQGLITATIPGQSSNEKAAKVQFLLDCFETRSWTAIENMNLEGLILGYDKLKKACAECAAKSQQPVKAG